MRSISPVCMKCKGLADKPNKYYISPVNKLFGHLTTFGVEQQIINCSRTAMEYNSGTGKSETLYTDSHNRSTWRTGSTI